MPDIAFKGGPKTTVTVTKDDSGKIRTIQWEDGDNRITIPNGDGITAVIVR